MFSRNFFLFIALLFIVQCSPPKKEITEGDLKRVLERVSIARINANLKSSSEKSAPDDLTFFLEACSVYRFDPDSVLKRLKLKSPAFYEALIKEYEK
ncbi:LA_1448 family UV-C exposure upregulated protein [Leptospira santarosai]|uniref:Uncharacterized protein n=1 Tax=Leptospira santarosai TaxID=28183 RepID=A0A2P1QWN0_9LEPT|nr:hypothetical protein [Leptospira santarosai]AVQ13311.1 Uncharacterized protein XB16_3011 [Leptospira santarosai]EMF91326.1 hypothetical protein LEP1GSC005_2788 [Leptospira santarosai str. ST188]EMO70607.1 hypothetical protein LEP1GSC130_3530 [Leptospira santarosai str. 200403458]EMO97634.1 hypothetical protein LEP1GSC120_0060 [Leptospira santarosai str. 200702252]UZN08402.1 hypothetical protein M5D10_05435 [Leptospira santarosai]